MEKSNQWSFLLMCLVLLSGCFAQEDYYEKKVEKVLDQFSKDKTAIAACLRKTSLSTGKLKQPTISIFLLIEPLPDEELEDNPDTELNWACCDHGIESCEQPVEGPPCDPCEFH